MYFSPLAEGEARAFTWGLFSVVAIFALLLSLGASVGPLVLVSALVCFVFCFRYIYSAFYFGLLLIPFSGWLLSIPMNAPFIGDRAFGGSIDLTAVDVILSFVILAWILKAIILTKTRKDRAWEIHPPLLFPFLALVLAHVVSAFSSAQPDPLLVLKYAFRPVLFSYVAWVLLPTHLIRSRRRLIDVCGIVAVFGTLFALIGLVSMAYPLEGLPIGRARPLELFGQTLLGENQNSLADVLIWTLPLTLALRLLVRDLRVRRVAGIAAGIQLLAGICTFTRTFWIAGAFEIFVFGLLSAREVIERHRRTITLGVIAMIPFAVAIAYYWVSPTAQSSNTTRQMLLEIAWNLFRDSPWIGVGAGTFVDHVAWTRLFSIEFGLPLDSHGIIQKLGAETGLFGLISFSWIWLAVIQMVYRVWKKLSDPLEKALLACIASSAVGAFVYQLLNTDYWTARLWLPLGILCAYLAMVQRKTAEHDLEDEKVVS